jgi:hypothetical protein
LLQHIDKWKLRDQEAPPTEERDNDNEDEPTLAERNKGRPNGRRKEKNNLKNKVDAESLREKMTKLMKSKQAMMDQALQDKDEIGQKEARR